MPFRFEDRFEAGMRLGEKLRHYQGRSDVVVLALPRGGVPVGFEVAQILGAPLDIFLVRKLGVPGYEELAMGAIATGGVYFLNEQVISSLKIAREDIDRAIEREKAELTRREQLYRVHEPLDIPGHIAILVDDGLATGATMRAAVRAVKQHQPGRVVVGIPVSARDTYADVKREVDEIVCVQIPEPFFAVGEWYEDFSQTTDEEVRSLLERSAHLQQPAPAHL